MTFLCNVCTEKASSLNFRRHQLNKHLFCPACCITSSRRHSCFITRVETGLPPFVLTMDNVGRVARSLESVSCEGRPSTVFVPVTAAGDFLRAACKVFGSRALGAGSERALAVFALVLIKDSCHGCQAQHPFQFHSCQGSVPDFLQKHFQALCFLFDLVDTDLGHRERLQNFLLRETIADSFTELA